MPMAWRNLTTQPMAAHATLARAALEGAVTCRWLIDPTIDREERRWRGAIVELEDRRQRRSWEAALGLDKISREPPAQSGAARYDEHVASMKAEGLWDIHRVRPAPSPDTPPPAPGMTELFANYALVLARGQGEWFYRTLSAFAHQRSWANVFLGEGTSMQSMPGVHGVSTGQYTSADMMTLKFATATMSALEVALRELQNYQGR